MNDEDKKRDILSIDSLDSIKIVFGDNWHALENWGSSVPTRWISDDAILNIYSTSLKLYNMLLKIRSYHKPFGLQVYLNGEPVFEKEIPIYFIKTSIILKLKKGKNIIKFHSMDGSDRPADIPASKNSDIRRLSFAFQDIMFSIFDKERENKAVSRDHVIWCYRILLGRDPENDEVIADKMNRLTNIEMLRNEILMSSEFSSIECQTIRQTKFVDEEYIKWAWEIILGQLPNAQYNKQAISLDSLIDSLLQKLINDKQCSPSCYIRPGDKILILGNCQTALLARVLSHMSSCKVEYIREEELASYENHNAILEKAEKANTVITQPLLSESFGKLQTTQMRTHIKNLIVIPNIYISGLHPDLIYVGEMGKRYQSPIGDYHSAIGIAAFLEEMRPSQAIHLYRDSELFRSAGFFEEWQQSLNEFKVREVFCDISILSDIIDNIINKPLLYSSNHPSLELIILLSKKILAHLGCDTGWVSFWRDEMQSNIIYPVWTPIGEYHRLAYRSPEIFFIPESKGSELSLPIYLENAFRQYARDLPSQASLNPKVIKLRSLLADRKE